MRHPKAMYVLRGPDGIDEVLAKLRSGPLAIDTESTGLDWWTERVGSINLASGTTAVFAYKDALAPVVRWLADEIQRRRSLVFHHAKFDMHMLRTTFGLHIPYPVHDTMLQSKLLDNRGARQGQWYGGHHLKGLARMYVDPFAQEPEKALMTAIHAAGGKDKGDWLLAPMHLYARYSALDPWYTLQLHQQFIERIRYWPQPDATPAYPSLMSLYKTEQWVTLALRDMEERGIKIRRRFLEQWRGTLQTEIADLKEQLLEASGGKDINWNSRPQLRALLFDPKTKGGLGLIPSRQTKAGQWSTDKKTLVRLDHPIAGALLPYSAAFKQYTAYAVNLLKMIKPDGAIHCDFNQNVDTNRMSCSNPNLQQQTRKSGVRAAYRPRKGQVFRFFDYCLAGNTLVETLTGPKAIRNIRAGDKVFAWKKGRITWDTVKKAALVGRLPAYRVTLDSGKSFIASGDHGLLLRDGERCNATDLEPGMSLAAMRYSTAGQGKYRTVYSWTNRAYEYVHGIIAEAYHGKKPVGYDVHHVNGNRKDNRPKNLQYLKIGPHRRMCAWIGVDQNKRLKALRVALKNRRSYRGVDNPNWRGGGVCRVCGVSFSQTGNHHGCCDLCRPRRNHKVLCVEKLGRYVPMYHLEMTKITHNFALSCGVISLNSQIEMRFAAHAADSPILIDGFNTDPDFDTHRATAQMMFAVKNPTPEQRSRGKTMNFAQLFGQGVDGITENLMMQMSIVEAYTVCKELGHRPGPSESPHRTLAVLLRDRYREGMPEMIKAARAEQEIAAQRGFAITEYGYHRYLDEDDSRLAFNTRIQGSAAGLAKRGLAAVYRELQLGTGELALLLQVHDELVAETDGDPRTDRRVLELMADTTTFKVPMTADAKGSPTSWQEKHELHL